MIARIENALWQMARSYGLGSPEARAIITAWEHAKLAEQVSA